MKNILYIIIFSAVLLLNPAAAHSQAWERDTKVLSLGLGASQFFHIDDYYYGNAAEARNWYSPVTGQINFQGEFGIHKYVGLGFTTGLGGGGPLLYGYQGELNFPIGMLANFHFYQLIADKTGKNIHADKLDIYAGVSVGGGNAIAYYNNVNNRIVPMAFGGLHAGVRYYFKPRVGVNGELGWGKSLVNVGFVFKL
jgi:hypothetical protein